MSTTTPPLAYPTYAPRQTWQALWLEWGLLAASTILLIFPTRWSVIAVPVVLIGLVLRHRLLGVWRFTTIADPFLALFGVMALVGVIVSPDLAVSLNRATVMLLGWLWFEATLVTVTLFGVNPRMLALTSVLGLGIATIGLLLTDFSAGILVPVPAIYDRLPHLAIALPGSGIPGSGGLLNPRTSAAVLLLLIPINLVLIFLPAQSVLWRGLYTLTTLLLVVGLTLTQTPQAIVALGAALGILLLAALPRRLRTITIIILLVIAVVGAWGIATIELPWSAILEGRGGFGLVARLEIWTRALRMIASAPYTGIGLNGYASVMNAFYPGDVLGPEAHAHNNLFQTLTDQGILGGLALVGLCATVLHTALHLLTSDSEPRIRYVVLAVIATFVAWGVYGLGDVLGLGNKLGIFLWVYAALPLALYRGIHTADVRGVLWVGMFGVVTVVALYGWVTGGLERDLAVVTAQQSLSSVASRTIPTMEALAGLTQVESRWEADPHRLRLKALLFLAQEDAEAAAGAFREVVALESNLPLETWSPAPVLKGTMQNEPVNVRAEGLAQIYRHWHIRFPTRIEPVILLAYLYHDTLKSPDRALQVIEEACRSSDLAHQTILSVVLTRLTLKSNECP